MSDLKRENDMLEGIADALRGDHPLAKASLDKLIELLDAEQDRNAAKIKALNSINDLAPNGALQRICKIATDGLTSVTVNGAYDALERVATVANANKLNSINDLYQHRVVHASMDESSGEIYLSAFRSDSPMWENNHIILKDARGSKHHSVLQILSNVLAQSSVMLKIEP